MYTIKKATLTDLEAVAYLFDKYRIFYQKPSDIKQAEAFINERLTNKDSEIFVCYNTDNVMMGFTQLYPLFSSTRMRKLWLLNDLFVDEIHRGKGVSIALIEKAKQLCVETDACGLMLETAKTNIVGNNLYPKTGFSLDNDHNYYSWDNE
jgi:GNAT superfamily N-acetyltransferase